MTAMSLVRSHKVRAKWRVHAGNIRLATQPANLIMSTRHDHEDRMKRTVVVLLGLVIAGAAA